MRVFFLVPALFLSGCLMQQPVAVVPEPVQVKPAAAKPAPKRVQATQATPQGTGGSGGTSTGGFGGETTGPGDKSWDGT